MYNYIHVYYIHFIGNLCNFVSQETSTTDFYSRRVQSKEILGHLQSRHQYTTLHVCTLYVCTIHAYQGHRKQSIHIVATHTCSFLHSHLCVQFLANERRASAAPGLSSISDKPYHYGSHYSNSGIVLHFLVRLPPFTEMFLAFQSMRTL